MSSTLDDLFQQIILSEQRAQRRKNYLNEVKAEIEEYQMKIKDTEEHTESLRGQLVLKTQQLNDEEFKFKWLTTRETILKSQCQSLSLEIRQSEEELVHTQDTLTCELESFCAQVREFTKGYALVENGQLARQQDVQQQLKRAIEEKERLERDLKTYYEQKSLLSALEEQEKKFQRHLDDLLLEENVVKQKLAEQQKAVDSILAEKRQVEEVPQTDTEFIKLQRELEIIKGDNPEQRCQDLQQELQSLQQCLWQKQLNRQKKVPVNKVYGPSNRLSTKSSPVNKSNVLKVTNFSTQRSQVTQMTGPLASNLVKYEPQKDVD